MHICKGFEKRTIPFLTKKKEQEEFYRKIVTDFFHDINLFSNYNSIVFCKDYHSWRKKLLPSYKVNRIPTVDVNWDVLYNLMDEFMDDISQKGVICSSIYNAEADDLIYLWKKYFKKNNESSIILTADSDLSQLVEFNNDTFHLIYNNNSNSQTITVPDGFISFVNQQKEGEIDIFNMDVSVMDGTNSIQFLKRILSEFKINEVNPEKILFEKILQGDKGDNVMSVYSWQKKVRVSRITPSYMEHFYNALNENNIEISIDNFKLDEDIREILRVALENAINPKKPILVPVDKKTFHENYIMNTNLIQLSYKNIPKEIREKFRENLSELKTGHPKLTNSIDFLKGGKYEKINKAFLSGIFTKDDK